jgi:hypothetical protein
MSSQIYSLYFLYIFVSVWPSVALMYRVIYYRFLSHSQNQCCESTRFLTSAAILFRFIYSNAFIRLPTK